MDARQCTRFLSTILFMVLPCLLPSLSKAESGHLERPIDALSLKGEQCAPLIGMQIQDLRLVVFKDDDLAPIPFQIDEKDPEGTYIFRTSNPDSFDEDRGQFDANDEIAFMARDLGDRLSGEKAHGIKVLAEITVTDPVDGAKAWCYVVSKEPFPQLSAVDYVTYDPADDRILTRNYRIGFSKEAPIAYGDTTVTVEGGGNNARINERVITRLKATFLKVIKLVRSEEDFRSTRKGYIDGPVRIIKRVGNSMRQVFGKYGPEVVVDYTFYLSNWIMPSIIDLPVDVGKYVTTLSLRGGTDWTQEAKGMVFYTKYIPPGVAVIDGHMSEAEKKMDLRLDIDHIWHLYTGKLNGTGQGSILFRILMDERLQKALTAQTYFYDKFLDPDYEEDAFSKDEYKSFFEGSYVWSGMESLPKGRYYLTSWATVMPDYAKPGDEQRYLNILDRPLEAVAAPYQP